jgi:hypothetical protein
VAVFVHEGLCALEGQLWEFLLLMLLTALAFAVAVGVTKARGPRGAGE